MRNRITIVVYVYGWIDSFDFKHVYRYICFENVQAAVSPQKSSTADCLYDVWLG